MTGGVAAGPASAGTGATGRPRLGRPRSESCDRAIETAAVELLVEEGFGRMTIEGVAARAGVGKATIYRRWATKAELVVDAVHQRCLQHWVVPDTGSVRTDMEALLRSILERFQADGPVMLAFVAEQGRHPDLAATFRRLFLAERRSVSQTIVRRGVDRGELLPGTDVELLADVGPALFWHRLAVTGAPLHDDLPRRIVAQFFGLT